MSKISIEGNQLGSGTFTIASPNSNTSRTLTLPDNTGTIITQNSTPAFASTIGVGGATPSTSGAGITFPAAQSASSNANTLDDYEEGTWTPTFGGQSGQSGQTYSSQTGRYTKVGNVVTATFELTLSNKGSITGIPMIKGLPFAAGGDESKYGPVMYFVDLTNNWIYIALQVFENNTSAFIWGRTSAGTSREYPGIGDFSNTTQFVGCIVYRV
jgi:hypothetical protein